MRLRGLFCLFLLLPAFAQAEESITRTNNFALKIKPYDYLIGSFNTEIEFRASDNLSFTIPVFFAHHDAAAIKDALFWNSSLGLSLGAKYHIGSQSLSHHGFFVAGDGGVFVVYPFEAGQKKVLYKGIYSELNYTKNPFWLPVFNFYAGYDFVFENGFMLEIGGGLTMYAQFPVPLIKLQTGWTF